MGRPLHVLPYITFLLVVGLAMISQPVKAQEEQPTIDFAYASVVSIIDIKKGERFSRENIWVKRPGTGPFYAEDYTSESASRNKARFAEALPFSELFEGVSKLLHKNGEFNAIIPHKEESNFISLARGFGLFPKKITRVRGNEKSEIKRSLLSFNFKKEQPEENELIT